MQIKEKVKGKDLAIYLRKERLNEDLINNGVGRLGWLEFEVESAIPMSDIYIDEVNETKELDMIINNIIRGNIEVLLIWSIEDIETNKLFELIQACINSDTIIVSFCEADCFIENIKDYVRYYTKKLGNR